MICIWVFIKLDIMLNNIQLYIIFGFIWVIWDGIKFM